MRHLYLSSCARNRLDTRRNVRPASPGGEPLCRLATQSVGSRRLPGATLGNVLSSASATWPVDSGKGDRSATRGVIRGSRLLATSRAASLQSGSPPKLGGDAHITGYKTFEHERSTNIGSTPYRLGTRNIPAWQSVRAKTGRLDFRRTWQ